MTIDGVEVRREVVPLTRPYTIAYKTTSAVEIFVLRLSAGGLSGFGAASPAASVTGETAADCAAALERARELQGRVPDEALAELGRLAGPLRAAPAALAAIDIALHDLAARAAGLSLVDRLGRRHRRLPTSVTIGIADVEQTLAQAHEHVGAGFRCLKIKLGRSIDEDEARLRRLREEFGSDLLLRVDANQGYAERDLPRLDRLVEPLALELVEQPLPVGEEEALRRFPRLLGRTALDESVQGVADARRFARRPPCAIFNIKLMKCGGIRPALAIAETAREAGLTLMWGCMDESVISIAGALHAAFASPATRHLDLDGSFDLARDPARGGFALEDGFLTTLDRAGLGVELTSDGGPG